MVNKMSLQFICFVALSCLLQCYVNDAALQPAVGPGGFFEWLAMILRPLETTTAAPATTMITATNPPITQPTPNDPIERQCSSCRCGLINFRRRHQYPWMAVLLFLDRFYCAGSLINDLYVITAAHCVEGVPPELITVRLMVHNRSESDDLMLQRQAVHVKTHELFNPRSFDNDIALIRLDQSVSFEAHLRPICLPTYSDSFDGDLAIVTGWGAVREGGFATDTLQEVDVLILSQSECRSSGYSPALITDNMICAGYIREGAKDACSGDSGGPLQVLFDEQPGQYQLAGIVSWGEGCARPNLPGVYTRVNEYLSWIEANTPDACFCMPYPEEDY